MHVHIVSHDLDKDRVLARLAGVLVKKLGWTVGQKPDPSADLNYFFPYLTYQPVKTRTAAWFTHYDLGHKLKVERWIKTAAAVDICTTSAKMYLPMLSEGAKLVTPPIERDRFVIGKRPLGKSNRVIGVSGYVYRDGRKGEDLIKQLVMSDLNVHVQWKASGRGWPIKTTHYQWEQVPLFFQSLDFYLCASRIEGIPMPPLEALACGVPVIIPRGVGILDDLPHLPGIYRFIAGDYDSLYAAVREALTDTRRIDREALRAVTEEYSMAAWCRNHRDIFYSEDLPVWGGHAGVYYVAFGNPARRCAERAIRSWKQHMPDVPVALVSTEPLGLEDVFIRQPDGDLGGRIAKLKVDELAPKNWQYVLYLDADTEITADVSFLFQVLQDGWEFVICKDASKWSSTKHMKRPDNHDEVAATYKAMGSNDLMQFNGGVFGFRRNKRTAAFFRAWNEEWQRWAKRDQAALLRALWRVPLKLFTLGSEWNSVPRYFNVKQTAGILHHAQEARRWNGIVWERMDDPKAFGRVVR